VGIKIKSAPPPPKIRCPKCQTVFATQERGTTRVRARETRKVAAPPPPAPARSKALLIFVALGVLGIAGGGAAAFFVLKSKQPPPTDDTTQSTTTPDTPAAPKVDPKLAETREQLKAGGQPGVESLTQLAALVDDAELRLPAVRAIGQIGAPAKAALPALDRVAQDPDPAFRIAVIEALGAMGADAAPVLIKALTTPGTPDMREAALKALAGLGPDARAAAPQIVPYLMGPQRAAAKEALRKIGAAAVPALVEKVQARDPALTPIAIETLGSLGPAASEAADPLGKELEGPFAAAAIQALGAIGPAGIPALTRALPSNDRGTRERVLLALGAMGPNAADAVPALAERFKQEDPAMRAAVGAALAAIGAAAIPALAPALKEADAGLRAEAVRALAKIGPAAMKEWVLAFEDADEGVIGAALASVRELADRAAPALAELLKHPDTAVRRAALRGLTTLGEEAQAAAGALPAMLSDADPKTRQSAVRLMVTLHAPLPAGALPTLLECLRDASAPEPPPDDVARAMVPMGPEAAAAAAALVTDPSGRGRAAGALVLANASPPPIQALVAMARGDDPEARVAAVEALGRIGPPAAEAAPMLVELALQQNQPTAAAAAAEALAGIGAPAVAPILQALDAQLNTLIARPGVRALARALFEMGSDAKDAVPWAVEQAKKNKQLEPFVLRLAAGVGPDAKPALPLAIEALKDPDADDDSAFMFLWQLGPDAAPAIPALTKIAADIKAVGLRRQYAVGILEEIGPPAKAALAQIEPLKELGEMRLAIAAARIDPTRRAKLLPAVRTLLDDETTDVEPELARRLLKAFGPEVAPDLARALFKRLQSNEPDVLEAARDSFDLPELAEAAAGDLVAALSANRVGAGWILALKEPPVQLNAIVPVMRQRLPLQAGSKDDVALAGALARIAPEHREAGLGILLEAIEGKPRDRKAMALAEKTLGTLGEPACAGLVDRLNHHLRWVRASASRALAANGKVAVPALTQALKDPRPLVREGAAQTLGKIGPEARDAAAALAALSSDPHEHIRTAAAAALKKISP
jgi:HEAT repeat protein